jgi:hypothetical protein
VSDEYGGGKGGVRRGEWGMTLQEVRKEWSEKWGN